MIIIGSLKLLVRRPRPRQNLTTDMAMGTNSGPDKFSFPSGHSSRAILCSNMLTKLFLSEEFAIYFLNKYYLAFAILFLNVFVYMTCLSRLLLNRHFLTDVLAGIFIGHFLFFTCFLF